jgi:hypothetical protein
MQNMKEENGRKEKGNKKKAVHWRKKNKHIRKRKEITLKGKETADLRPKNRWSQRTIDTPSLN